MNSPSSPHTVHRPPALNPGGRRPGSGGGAVPSSAGTEPVAPPPLSELAPFPLTQVLAHLERARHLIGSVYCVVRAGDGAYRDAACVELVVARSRLYEVGELVSRADHLIRRAS